ncbi:MAG: FecCD family ABC transporter permease [Planctomycetota bacterium]|jgi:iron complex transport system permease protein
MLKPGRLIVRITIGLLLLAVMMMVCLMIGSQKELDTGESLSLFKALQGPQANGEINLHYIIFFSTRLPRIALAAIVGAALACAGVVFQAILRNPLADPYILGISSGAGLGAIVAVIFGWTWMIMGISAIMIAAFVAAMATVWLVWFVGQTAGRSNITGLLLAGVVINAFLSAVMMFLSSIVKAGQLQTTIIWLMGNMNLPGEMAVLWAGGGIVLFGIIVLLMVSNRLNILSMGAEEARSLGLSVERTCLFAFGIAALITSIAVSLSGLVGFVGLVVPHAVRLVAGPDHRQLIPLSAIVGAIFLVIADTFARTIIAPEIMPVGVVTAIVGGPFFLILLIRYTRSIHWGKS